MRKMNYVALATLSFASAMLYMSCNGCGREPIPESNGSEVEIEEENNVRKYSERTIIDSMSMAGHTYLLQAVRKPSKRVIHDEEFGETYDNDIVVTLKCDGSAYFQDTLSKELVKNMIAEDMYSISTLEELRLNHDAEGSVPSMLLYVGQPPENSSDLTCFTADVYSDGKLDIALLPAEDDGRE